MQDVETMLQPNSMNFYLDNNSEEELSSMIAYFSRTKICACQISYN